MAELIIPTLYKFYPLETAQQFVYLTRAIQFGEIFAGAPKDFNDPFDCCPTFKRDYSPEVVVSYFAKAIGRHRRLPPFHPDVLHAATVRAKELADGVSEAVEEMNYAERGVIQQLQTIWGVSCFSESYNNVLMWSHYASKHQGVCIEIPGSEFNARGRMTIGAVEYAKERPALNMLEHENGSDASTMRLASLSFFVKDENWRYEREWRAIRSEGPGLLKLPKACVSGITLGARMSQAMKNAVMHAAREAEHDVTVYQAHLSASRYEVERDSI